MHGHNIHSLATVNYQLPRGETLFHLPLTNILENIQRPFTNNPKIFKDISPTTRKYSKTFHQQPENIQRLFRLQICLSRKSSTTRKYSKTFSPANLSSPQIINNPKIFKDFFACKIVLAANHQLYSGNIQGLFGQSTAATSSSNQQQPPAAAINSSNQQQQSTAATSSSNQQQQPKAATSNSNQQQQPAAAINSSNQKQRPATAINSSNQKQHSTTTINCSNNQLSTYQHHLHNLRRPTLDTITVPSSGYVLLEVDLGLATRLRVHLPPLPRFIFVTFRFF